MDDGKITILISMDIKKAFDAISQQFFLLTKKKAAVLVITSRLVNQ